MLNIQGMLYIDDVLFDILDALLGFYDIMFDIFYIIFAFAVLE